MVLPRDEQLLCQRTRVRNGGIDVQAVYRREPVLKPTPLSAEKPERNERDNSRYCPHTPSAMHLNIALRNFPTGAGISALHRAESQRSREPHCGGLPGPGATASFRARPWNAARGPKRAANGQNIAYQRRKARSPGSSRHRGPYLHREPEVRVSVIWLPERNPLRTSTAIP
jgi:hypothetical protein